MAASQNSQLSIVPSPSRLKPADQAFEPPMTAKEAAKFLGVSPQFRSLSMSSQPSIDPKPQPSQGLSDTTGVPRVHRSGGESNRLDNAGSVGGLQIVQDQGKEALIDRDRPVKSRSQVRRSDSRQMTTVQPLAHSVKGAADSINASKGLLYNAIKLYAKDPERGLRARKLMGRTVILHSDLMDWLNRLPVKNAPSATHSERGHQRWAAAQRRENSAE